jgi:hypothetical protein
MPNSTWRPVLYFNEQYFTKIDKDVRSYYSLEIDRKQSSNHIAGWVGHPFTTDPTQAADSVYQAQKAQWVVGKLKRGEEVSQSEIDDALDVPPQSISRDARRTGLDGVSWMAYPLLVAALARVNAAFTCHR